MPAPSNGSTLPPEILWCIMDHIDEPRERRNIHLVCRRWNIYLRHLAWRKIAVEDGERAGKLIEVLLANESLRSFIREIRFPGPNSKAYVWPGTRDVPDPWAPPFSEEMDQDPADFDVKYVEMDYEHKCDAFCIEPECVGRREAIAEERLEVFSRVDDIALRGLDEAVLQEWREGIASPTSIHWICLLLVLLPNLRRIGVCQQDFEVQGFFQTIHWMSQSSERSTTITAFDKLEEVSVLSGWSACYSPAPLPMFWLPNLKVLRLCDFHFGPAESLGRTFQPLVPPANLSSIQELYLSTGTAMTDEIPAMIVACKRLEVFSLQFEERKEPRRANGFLLNRLTDLSNVFDIRDIFSALLKHEGSLRQLRFNDMGNVNFWHTGPVELMQLGSMKGFTHLEDLQILTAHVLHAESAGLNPQWLTDRLPRNLRSLTLTKVAYEAVEPLEQNLYSMLDCQHTEFPMLKTIAIERPSRFHPPYDFVDWGHDYKCSCFFDKMSKVRELCVNKGVEFTVLDVDFTVENSWWKTYQHVC